MTFSFYECETEDTEIQELGQGYMNLTIIL